MQSDVRKLGRLRQGYEVPRHSLRINRRAQFGREHQSAVRPQLTGEQLLLRLYRRCVPARVRLFGLTS